MGTSMPTAGAPPVDPNDLLTKLQRIVDSKTKKGGPSWVQSLILVAVVLAGAAVWSWISWRSNRELARLRHERAKAKLAAAQAATAREVEATNTKVDALKKKVSAAEEQLRLVDADIRAVEDKYEANLRAVGRIRTWRDAGVRTR